MEPIRPKKSLGQNFLSDPNTARKIVAALGAGADAPVVEIGPGMGALTGHLLERFPRVTAIEVDPRAVAYLRERYPSLDVRHADVLGVDWAALAAEHGGRLQVVGNLPYYLTSPILLGLLAARRHLAEVVAMMQLEVAERLVAPPGTKAYGTLSVYVQLYTEARLLFRVSRNVFHPKPDVTSAVLRMTFGSRPDPGIEHAPLEAVVRAAFNQRRKTLRNSLSAWTRVGGLALPEGWDRRRAEELSPDEFVALARLLGPPPSP